MKRSFTLEYGQDDCWLAGRLKEVPGVFSQGKTLDELKENIADAYRMMLDTDSELPHMEARTLELMVDV